MRMMPFVRAAICLTAAVAVLPAAQEAILPATMLMGTNHWYKELDERAWERCAEAKVAMVRIGGGSFDKKIPGDKTLTSYARRIQRIGAEVLMQVSGYDPPEQAAGLVRMFNKDLVSGKRIQFWSIGNEPWLRYKRPGELKLAGLIEAYFKPIAAAMKEVDPTISICGPDECDFMDDTYGALFGGKNDISGKVPGKEYYFCDVLTWHRYPQTDHEPGLDEIGDFRRRMERCETLVRQVNAQAGRTGTVALQWGLTEYNAKGGAQVHSFGNGQMFGGVLGYARAHGASFALSWSMFESSGNRGKTDFGLFDGKELTPRPSYWHLAQWGVHFGDEPIPVVSSQPSALGFASRSKDRFAVMLMNTASGEPVPYSLAFSGKEPATGLGFVVDIGKPGLYQDVLGPQTTHVLVFADGKLSRAQYSAALFAAGAPAEQKTETTTLRP